MKKIIIVTGGAGFIGSNMIKKILERTSYDIISLDNYSSGYRSNHFKNNRVKYVKGETSKINQMVPQVKIKY